MEEQVQVYVKVEIKVYGPKMDQFSKFKMLFTLKLNLNVGQFYREISKFGYFNNFQTILKIVEKSWIFAIEAGSRKFLTFASKQILT